MQIEKNNLDPTSIPQISKHLKIYFQNTFNKIIFKFTFLVSSDFKNSLINARISFLISSSGVNFST